MQGWLKKTRRHAFCVALAAVLAASCERVSISADQIPRLTETCLVQIANDALNNPHTNTIAADLAGPLGLVASSDPEAVPYISKQVEFAGVDGAMHYFSVDSARWTKAVLIVAQMTSKGPRLSLYVLDRRGSLIAGGVIQNGRMRRMVIEDPIVRRNFQSENQLWVNAGPPICRSGFR